MKRLLMILVGICTTFSFMANAQNTDLATLPKRERDNLAIQIAVTAMKEYAPTYYSENIAPSVHEGKYNIPSSKHYGEPCIVVRFPFDVQKAMTENREGENMYGGDVYILTKTGAAVGILPTGWMILFEIKEPTTRSVQKDVAQPTTVPRNPFKK